jgi:integrase
MTSVSITKRWLDSLKTPQRDTVWWDDKLEGFGVRATPAGSVSFLVQYRNAQGRSRRLTIGPWGAYTPAKAREEAEELLREAHAARKGKGVDPAERKREERNAITFKQFAAEYMEKAKAGLILGRKGKPKKPGTVAIDRYRIAHLNAHFGQKLVKNIDRADCQRCMEKLIAGMHGAARTYGLLGGMFTYAIEQGHIVSNPAHGIRKPADGRREFRLDVGGYRALGKAVEAAEVRAEPWQAVAAIRLLALTGCRKGEILKLRLSEVDLSGRCLRLDDTKTGESMRALGEAALRVLKTAMNRPGRAMSPYVLPGRDPRKPFNGLGGAWTRIVGDGFTPHSLRHAFASACDELDLSELTIAMLLGHASAKKGSTTRGYIAKPDAVLLAAADKVSRHIWQAMTTEGFSAVIELPRTVGVA